MSNARLSILQARAVKDRRISDAQFRTLAALGMYADEDGWCFPMLATLGKDLGKSKQAVGRDTIALRKLGYLEVRARYDKNGARRSSLYRLKFDLPPVNMDDSTPSTSEVDTPSTNSVDTPSTSEVDVNDPINDPYNPPINLKNAPLEWKLGHNEEITNQDLTQSKAIEDAPRMFERAFGFGKLPWASNKAWDKFQKFITEIYLQDQLAFGNYVVWRGNGGKYKAMSNKQIRMNPQIFMDTGWYEFINRDNLVGNQDKGVLAAQEWLTAKGVFNG